jgi:23S rRNA (uracil1939-C5)-methyltransferase
MNPGDVVSLTIEKPAAGGRMIARADRLVVLVAGTMPGERVRARIERIGKGVAYATAEAIDDASTDRRTTEGDPFCGGCLYAHIAYPRQLELKSLVIADAFRRVARMELPVAAAVHASPEEGYRMRARIHVRGRHAGFFREGTHEVCQARQTRQLLPATADVLETLVSTAQSLGLEGLREIELAENVDTTHRAVHLAFADGAATLEASGLDRLASTDGLTGVSSPRGTRGDIHVTDTIRLEGHAPLCVRRHAQSFFQGNRYLLEPLVAHVTGKIPAGSDALDLYAGVGLFALHTAAARGVRVTAVEGDHIAAADLAANAAAAENGDRVAAVHQSVEEFVDAWRGATSPDGLTVIVDPPRTGLSRVALEGICRLPARRIIYVSCDVATLARDARRIVDDGRALVEIDAFDLFPNTPHVETVAVFERP